MDAQIYNLIPYIGLFLIWAACSCYNKFVQWIVLRHVGRFIRKQLAAEASGKQRVHPSKNPS